MFLLENFILFHYFLKIIVYKFLFLLSWLHHRFISLCTAPSCRRARAWGVAYSCHTSGRPWQKPPCPKRGQYRGCCTPCAVPTAASRQPCGAHAPTPCRLAPRQRLPAPVLSGSSCFSSCRNPPFRSLPRTAGALAALRFSQNR